MEFNLSEEPELSSRISSDLFLFTHRMKFIHTHMHPHARARARARTHTHTHTHTHMHAQVSVVYYRPGNRSVHDLDEVNSVTVT